MAGDEGAGSRRPKKAPAGDLMAGGSPDARDDGVEPDTGQGSARCSNVSRDPESETNSFVEGAAQSGSEDGGGVDEASGANDDCSRSSNNYEQPPSQAPQSLQESQETDSVEGTAAQSDSEDGGEVEDMQRSSEDEAHCTRASRRRGRGGGEDRVLRRGRSRAGKGSADGNDESLDKEDLGLLLGRRILQDLMNTNSTFLYFPESKKGMVDYHNVIEEPMWFEEIQRRFNDHEYISLVDFVKDVRLLLLNVYRYFGPNSLFTKRALRIEQVLEHKLSSLPKDFRMKCSLQSTHGITSDGTNSNVSRKGGDFFSHLLQSVAGEREKREQKRNELLSVGRQFDLEGRGKESLVWETEVLLAPPAITQMRTMWEIPLIGHLIQLTVQVLCVEPIPQYEVERIFLMPQASKSLSVLMTSLLSSPSQRTKLQQSPSMPYSIWSRRLSQKVAVWYKMFQTRNHDWSKIFELCGIEKEFWDILGDWNQLEDYEFHELSFHQRVWLVKSLCDFQVHNHKTMQDALAEHSQQEQNCNFLGEDRHGRQYLHFPQFCSAPGLSTCVRVYRCVIPVEKSRSPDFPEEICKVSPRTGRGDFMPTWMKGRGRGRGKAARGKGLKKRTETEIMKQKYISKTVYRMPNGMHIRGRKKQATSRVPDGIVSGQISLPAASDTLASENHANDSQEKSKTSPSNELNKRKTRLSTRKKSQGFYADWSDSDSLSSSSSSSSLKKTVQRGRSTTSASRKSGSHKHATSSIKSSSSVSCSQNIGETLKGDKHDSACEEVASRSTRSSLQDEKGVDVANDSEDVEEDDKDEKSNLKKEDNDFNLVDDISWTPKVEEPQDEKKMKRPHFNPDWMLLGAEHFELVADSVQGVRDLIESLCEDDDVDLTQRLRNTTSSCKPVCEEKLKQHLNDLIDEIEPLEVKLESNAQKLRLKLFDEWEEFKNRPKDVKDESEAYWITFFERDLDILTSASSHDIKSDVKLVEPKDEACSVKIEKNAEPGQTLKFQDDESLTGNEIRHSLRAKKPKINNLLNSWLNSDSEEMDETDEEEDDAWVLPCDRKKRRATTGRSRKSNRDAKSDDDTAETASSKKNSEKLSSSAKNFSFESFPPELDSSQTDTNREENPSGSNISKLKHKKMLPNKLTLDKEGNMFITLGCGTKVELKKDEDGRIIVPEGHEGLSMINGKTLEQLLGSGKVVQKKKRNRKQSSKPPNNTLQSEFQPAKRSTTLFPAIPLPSGIIQAKEWTPPVVKDVAETKDLVKIQTATSIQAKEWTPPLERRPFPLANNAGPAQSNVKTYPNRSRNVKQKTGAINKTTVAAQAKKMTEPQEIVVLSDGSDDSIEVIKESDTQHPQKNAGPRIESVVGNATADAFAPKPLNKSVTMTPVIKTNSPSTSTIKKNSNQWSPVISNTVSLEPVAPSSSRVRPPGAPQVIITPAKKGQVRRNLQQTGVYHQPSPNQSFVPISNMPMHQTQSQFIPVNQIMPITNQFPVNQVVGMNNQYVMANSPYSQMGNQFLINPPQTFQYMPVTSAPVPLPLPVSAFDIGLPPGLTGEIVLANADNNKFSYAFKLDDGGLIFLSNEQVSKIRAANGGKLTTMVQFRTL